MTQHTPGPWRACVGNHAKREGLTLCSCGQIWSVTADVHLATVERDRNTFETAECVRDPHEAEANAHLIAAAPRMKEALEDVCNWLSDFPHEMSDQSRLLLARCELALCEATAGVPA